MSRSGSKTVEVSAAFEAYDKNSPQSNPPSSLYPTITDDVTTLRVLRRRAKYTEVALESLFIDKFEKRASNTPDRTFMMFEDQTFSYGLIDQWACRVASVAISSGLKCGNTVALMMENEPAFVWTFLGRNKGWSAP